MWLYLRKKEREKNLQRAHPMISNDILKKPTGTFGLKPANMEHAANVEIIGLILALVRSG